MIDRIFGIEGFIDYHSGWLRVGRRWFGYWRGGLRVVPVIMGGTSANTTQEDFWFRNDDGSLTTATYMGSQNSNQTINGDTVFRIRIIVQENNGKNDPWSFQLGAAKNGGGTYTLITTTRTDGIKYADDANSIADGAAIGTADFDLSWSGTPVAGEYDDAQTTAGTGSIQVNGEYTELEFCLVIDSANASNGDYWDLQVLDTGGGALDGYTTTPRVTASISATLTAEQGSFGLTGQQVYFKRGQFLRVDLEEGDNSDFDTETGATYLSYTNAAALKGSYGLEVDATSAAGADSHGNNAWTTASDRLRYRIYVDPNTISLTAGDEFYPLVITTDGTVGGISTIGRIMIRNNAGTLQVNHFADEDDGSTRSATYVTMPTSPFYIEGEMVRATGPTDVNGSHQYWLNGSLQTGADTDVDNWDIWETINGSAFGADSLDVGTTGVLYVDDLIINDDGTEIGPGGANPLIAEQGSFTLTGQITLLEASRLLTAGQGSFVLTGQIVLFELTKYLAMEQGSFTLTGQDVDLLASRLLTAEQGSFVLTGQDVGLAKTITMAAEQGSFTLTGQDIGLLASRLLTMEQGSFVLTGQDTGLVHQFPALIAEQGSITLTGQDVLFELTKYLAADFGSFTLAGQDVTLTKIGAYELIAEQGSFTLTGQTTGLLSSRLLTVGQGSFVLAGQDVGLAKVVTFVAEQGSFTLTGQTTGLLASRLITMEQGSFVLAGQDVSLIYTGSYLLTAEQGSFVLAGQTAGLLANRLLTMEAGAAVISGQDVGLLASLLLTAGQGSFTLTGIDATLSMSIVKLVLEQTAYIVQVVEQDANIVQIQEQDANIVQVVEQTAVLTGDYET